MTRSQETQEALADRELLASIVDGSHDAVIAKTLDGVVTSWNKAAEEIFGYTAGEMIGQSILILFPQDHAFEEDLIRDRLRRGERTQHFETVRLTKDGRRIDVSLSVSPISDQAGRVVGASKIVRDITEQKALRSRLAEVQSELLHISRLNDMGQLAQAFAHELNQPLSAINAYIGGAKRLIQTGDTARAIEGCDRAVAQVARAGEVIRRLRDFVRKGDRGRAVEDLGVAIEEAVALVLIDARREGIATTVDVAEDAASAFIDKVQIQQVLVNLVRNAAEAMAGGDRRDLTISTHRVSDKMIEVRVADSGPGLDPEVAATLFQPFNTTTVNGMGVGLSLCRSIVESQGGEISARNGDAGGAVFHFTLPAS